MKLTSLKFIRRISTPTAKQVINNTAWLAADKIIKMGVGLVLGVWTARYLGPSNFGRLNFCLAWAAIFTPIASLGFEGILVREYVNNPEHSGAIASTTFFFRILSGSTAFIASLAALIAYKSANTELLIPVAISSLATILQASDVFDMFFQSKSRSKIPVIARNLSFTIASGFKIYLIFTKQTLLYFVIVSTAEVAFSSIGIVYFYSKLGPKPPFVSPKFELGKAIIKDSWPLIFSSIMIVIYMKINQVMLEAYAPISEVGKFSAAARISEAFYFVPVSICASLFPKIIQIKSIDFALYKSRMQSQYDSIVVLCLAFAIPVSFFSHYLTDKLFGAAFNGTGSVLQIQVWTSIFVGLGVARSTHLAAMNWTKFHLVSVSLGCLTSVILNYLLIPKFGATGAAIASLFAYWISAHAACLVDRDLWPTFRQMCIALFFPRPWRW